jgi:hypothetical protein
MSYFVRAFCKKGIPTLGEIRAYLQTRGVNASITDIELAHGEEWCDFSVRYDAEKPPIAVEAVREPAAVSEEIDEFIDLIEHLPSSGAANEVLAHLRATRSIVAMRIPTADIDDEGWRANDEFLGCLVERAAALVQADGEGFYKGEDLILELE